MEYSARNAYRSKDVVSEYDMKRFRSLKGRVVHRMELRIILNALKYVGVLPPATILDVPCGTGRLSVHLASKGFIIKSVDLSPEMVRYTQQKVKGFHLENNIVVEVGDAENLSYPDNSFDACVSLRLFGHTPRDNRVSILRELSRVTRKYLVLAYCTKNSLQHFLRKKKRETKKVEWYPATYKQIVNEMKMAGLEKVKCFPLLTGVSETIIVLAKKTKDENSSG